MKKVKVMEENEKKEMKKEMEENEKRDEEG